MPRIFGMKTFAPRIRENKVVLIGGEIRSDVLKKPQNIEPQNIDPQNIEPQNVEPQKCFGHVEINFGLVFFCGSAVLLSPPPTNRILPHIFGMKTFAPNRFSYGTNQFRRYSEDLQICADAATSAGVETQRPESAGLA